MSKTADSAREAALSVVIELLTALGERDWDSVARCFHPNATLFVPESEGTESLRQWNGEPEHLRARLEEYSAETNWINLGQAARRLQIEVFGRSAIVWLNLHRRNCRQREIVLNQSDGAWQIVHFHLRFFGELNRLRSSA